MGLEVEGRTFVEGEFLDTVIGIPDSRTEIVMLGYAVRPRLVFSSSKVVGGTVSLVYRHDDACGGEWHLTGRAVARDLGVRKAAVYAR